MSETCTICGISGGWVAWDCESRSYRCANHVGGDTPPLSCTSPICRPAARFHVGSCEHHPASAGDPADRLHRYVEAKRAASDANESTHDVVEIMNGHPLRLGDIEALLTLQRGVQR